MHREKQVFLNKKISPNGILYAFMYKKYNIFVDYLQ